MEDKYPDLIFLKDGELYQIEGENFMVLGADIPLIILRG